MFTTAYWFSPYQCDICAYSYPAKPLTFSKNRFYSYFYITTYKISNEEMVELLSNKLREGSEKFRWPKYSNAMDRMIDKFQSNSGGYYSGSLLN